MMAGFTDIKIKTELRPCIFSGRKALFHKFIEISKVIPPSLMMGGHNGGQLTENAALIEFEDGSIHRVKDIDIKFCDNKFNEYCFEGGKDD